MILQVKFVSVAEKNSVLGLTATDTTVAGFVKIIDRILDPQYSGQCILPTALVILTVLAEVGEEVGQTVWIGATQAVITVIMAILSRQKRDPARGTNRVLGNGIIKSNALSS